MSILASEKLTGMRLTAEQLRSCTAGKLGPDCIRGLCQTNVAGGAGRLYHRQMSRKSRALPPSPFRRSNSSPEVIRLVVMMYVRFPLSLRNVEDLLFERGIDVCHETVRMWWNRFGRRCQGKCTVW